MRSLRSEALDMLSRMPDEVGLDDILYQLYVLDKIRKGEEEADQGDSISVEELREEMKQW